MSPAETPRSRAELFRAWTVRSISHPERRYAPGRLLRTRGRAEIRAIAARLYRFGRVPPGPTDRMTFAAAGNVSGSRGLVCAAMRSSNSESTPGAPENLVREDSLRGDQVQYGVFAWSDHQIRALERPAARPSKRLPYFNSMSKNNRPKFAGAQAHGPHDGCQMRMQSDDQDRIAARQRSAARANWALSRACPVTANSLEPMRTLWRP